MPQSPLGIEAAGGGGDHAGAFHSLAVLAAAEDQRVEPVLLGKAVGRLGMAAAGLDENDLGVEVCLFVHLVDEMIREGAQEVALAELDDLLRRVLEQVTGIALLFQGLKA